MLFWAIENELLLCTNSQPTYFDSNRKNLLALGEHARRLDPTRPILIEGDGDIDGDGNVGTNDILASLGDWGPDCDGCPADVDGDGDVDVDDLLTVVSAFGPC